MLRNHRSVHLNLSAINYCGIPVASNKEGFQFSQQTDEYRGMTSSTIRCSGYEQMKFSPVFTNRTTGCKRNSLVTATISSHLFMWAIERWRERIIIIHSPGNPSFLYGHTYCYPVGGLPWELSKPDMAVATAAVSVCC